MDNIVLSMVNALVYFLDQQVAEKYLREFLVDQVVVHSIAAHRRCLPIQLVSKHIF